MARHMQFAIDDDQKRSRVVNCWRNAQPMCADRQCRPIQTVRLRHCEGIAQTAVPCPS